MVVNPLVSLQSNPAKTQMVHSNKREPLSTIPMGGFLVYLLGQSENSGLQWERERTPFWGQQTRTAAGPKMVFFIYRVQTHLGPSPPEKKTGSERLGFNHTIPLASQKVATLQVAPKVSLVHKKVPLIVSNGCPLLRTPPKKKEEENFCCPFGFPLKEVIKRPPALAKRCSAVARCSGRSWAWRRQQKSKTSLACARSGRPLAPAHGEVGFWSKPTTSKTTKATTHPKVDPSKDTKP